MNNKNRKSISRLIGYREKRYSRLASIAFAFIFLFGNAVSSYAGQIIAELTLEKGSFTQFMSPVVADADNDGQNEVLASNIEMWEMNNSGCEVVKYDWGNCYGQAYCPTWKAGIPIDQSRAVVIAVGNLDLDPDNEVVVANTSPSDVNSNGRLTIWKHTTGDDYDSCWSMTVSEGIGDLAIGDCDNDGENELAAAYNYYWRGIKIFKRVGECQYQESASIYTGKDNHTIDIADLDNDDSLEIVATSSNWGTEVCIWKYRNGSYQQVWCYPLDNTGSPYTASAEATVGDIDNDGNNEILVTVGAHGDPNTWGIYVFEHTIGDSYELSWSETGPSKDCHYPFIGDIFNDGGNEFLVVRNDTLLVYAYSCSGYDTFLVKQLSDRPTGEGGVYVGDADNDGYNEVVTSGKGLMAYQGSGQSWLDGDANGNRTVDVGDVVYLINYLFKSGQPPCHLEAGDANGSCVIDVGDVVYLINYLFKGGPAPVHGCTSNSLSAGGYGASSNVEKMAGIAQVGLVASEKSIDIDAQLPTDAAGVQLEFSYSPEQIQSIVPELTDQTREMTLFFSAKDGILKIGILDLAGENLIPAGEGVLVKLNITGSDLSSLELQKAIMVNENASPFQVTILPREEKQASTPKDFELSQNIPNPFNPETEISYTLPNDSHVKLVIYNVTGQRVKTLLDRFETTGPKTVQWDGTDEIGQKVSSGIYFYKLEAGEFTQSRKMVMMK